MVKTHTVTGLKYLCYTQRDDWQDYTGSGTLWKRHLKKHGPVFTTELLLETDDYAEFKRVAIEKSKEFDVIESDEWANLKLEEGDGGDTVSSKMWITDGKTDRYILKTDQIPEGWTRGRSKCIFKNSELQKSFGQRVDFKKRGQRIKAAWDSGKVHRNHSKCGVTGPNNPACRPEVKEKMRKSALRDSKRRSEAMKARWAKKKAANNA